MKTPSNPKRVSTQVAVLQPLLEDASALSLDLTGILESGIAAAIARERGPAGLSPGLVLSEAVAMESLDQSSVLSKTMYPSKEVLMISYKICGDLLLRLHRVLAAANDPTRPGLKSLALPTQALTDAVNRFREAVAPTLED